MEFKDYYAILGVAKDAELKEIKKAYRKLALEFHRPRLCSFELRSKPVAAHRKCRLRILPSSVLRLGFDPSACELLLRMRHLYHCLGELGN